MQTLQIPVRSRGWAVRGKKFSSSTGSTVVGNSSFYMTSTEERRPSRPLSSHGLTTEAIGKDIFTFLVFILLIKSENNLLRHELFTPAHSLR